MDCDDTLCSDTTDFVLESLGISPYDEFWPRVKPKIERGWDPPLAYMGEFIKITEERDLKVTKKTLEDIGRKIQFYEGVPKCFQKLEDIVSITSRNLDLSIGIEFYVISSGFEDVLKASSINSVMKEIFGCTFEYDGEGNIASPKSIVTFTEKTKFIFAINKGISGDVLRKNPGIVNHGIPAGDRRIPLQNMIYIGDGPTDIPCFSVIRNAGGKGIGIIKRDKPERGVPLWKGRRITVGPYKPVYADGSDLWFMLEQLVNDIALDISRQVKTIVLEK